MVTVEKKLRSAEAGSMMKKQIFRVLSYITTLIVLAWLAGCAPPFPRPLLDQVDHRLTFEQLLKDPDRSKGAVVMLGGVIVDTKNTAEGSTIEVLRRELDHEGRPQDSDESTGRFLVQSDEFLDSAVFHRGRFVTVIGEVVGKKSQPLDEITYQYPLLKARSIHLWRPYSGPHFFFGIGVSGRM